MSHSFISGGNIPPCRFVSQTAVTASNRVVTLSASGDLPIGISAKHTHLPPLLGLNDGYVAISGMSVGVHTTPDEEAWLELGGTVVPGDLIKPDTGGAGKGVVASSDANNYGARALSGGVSGQIVKVKLQFGQRAS